VWRFLGRVVPVGCSRRGGPCAKTPSAGWGTAPLTLHVPTRGLIGLRSEFATDTRGTGVMHRNFLDFRPVTGNRAERTRGVMIAKEDGDTTAYSLEALEPRGILFSGASEKVYVGQVVGEHSRPMDIVVNPCKKKHLTNMRSSTSDIAVKLVTPHRKTLEEAIEYVAEDELVEVTPQSVRLRKKTRDHGVRRGEENRAGRMTAVAED